MVPLAALPRRKRTLTRRLPPDRRMEFQPSNRPTSRKTRERVREGEALILQFANGDVPRGIASVTAVDFTVNLGVVLPKGVYRAPSSNPPVTRVVPAASTPPPATLSSRFFFLQLGRRLHEIVRARERYRRAPIFTHAIVETR